MRRLWFRGFLRLLFVLGLGVRAADPAAPDPARDVKVSPGGVVRVGAREWRIGLVRLSEKERTLEIPCRVNQRSNVIEYALVTTSGKTHESLFATEASPRDIHVAALLLRAEPGSPFARTNQWLALPASAAVSVEVAWKEGDREVRHSLDALAGLAEKPDQKPEPLAPTPWLYNGSRVQEGAGFLAEQDGSIISLIFDPDALINNPRPDRDNDDIHFPLTPLIPPVGTPATIRIHCPGPGR